MNSVYNFNLYIQGHILRYHWVVFIYRFDCIYIFMYMENMQNLFKCYEIFFLWWWGCLFIRSGITKISEMRRIETFNVVEKKLLTFRWHKKILLHHKCALLAEHKHKHFYKIIVTKFKMMCIWYGFWRLFVKWNNIIYLH
jgi:hypothetical protein